MDTVTAVVGTGYSDLDIATGPIGGLPCGRISEYTGPLAGGALALALGTAKSQCSTRVAWFGKASASDFKGSRVERHMVGTREPLRAVKLTVEQGQHGLVVIDDPDLLVPDYVGEGYGEETRRGFRTRWFGQALRELTGLAAKTPDGAAILFVTHRPTGPMVMPDSVGGNALKFYASMRFQVTASRDDEGEVVPGRVSVQVVKNKFAEPFKSAVVIL